MFFCPRSGCTECSVFILADYVLAWPLLTRPPSRFEPRLLRQQLHVCLDIPLYVSERWPQAATSCTVDVQATWCKLYGTNYVVYALWYKLCCVSYVVQAAG
eukprot:3855423-Pyramimonas_sp.AAC.1